MNRSVACAANYSIAVVNYKSAELTRTCLELLRQGLGDSGVPVWVVDNDSRDASTDYLRGLDWIHLIERKPAGPEAGSDAHGRALDLVLENVTTDYLFLLHTDTFIHDPSVFQMMIDQCKGPRNIAAVGCLEQLDRGLGRTAWRLTSRFMKHYFRRGIAAAGFKGRLPKPYKEVHLKSFCTLWNVRRVKQHGLHFCMDERNPGYELQDRMTALGYGIVCLSPRKIFSYLDHIQSGTVSALGGYSKAHRRVKMYEQLTGKNNPILVSQPSFLLNSGCIISTLTPAQQVLHEAGKERVSAAA